MYIQVTSFASPLHIYSCSAFGKSCVPVRFYACSQESANQGSEDTKQVCVFELVLQSGVAFVILIINFAYSMCVYHVLCSCHYQEGMQLIVHCRCQIGLNAVHDGARYMCLSIAFWTQMYRMYESKLGLFCAAFCTDVRKLSPKADSSVKVTWKSTGTLYIVSLVPNFICCV